MSAVALVPSPVSVVARHGTHRLQAGAPVRCAPGAEEHGAALARGIGLLFGRRPALTDDPRASIHVSVRDRAGHRLQVNSAGVLVEAATPEDAFHAGQTLRQLAPVPLVGADVDGVDVPCVDVEDRPRFGWRGLMVDVCRHFFGVEVLRRFVDLLALHKMNVLHLHLTEDQAWRIEVRGHPRLTEHAAWRTGADGARYGGFLAQDELRSLVAYAAERHVTIVPEVELPGHATAALSAYPHLSCSGGPFEIPSTGGIYEDVFCTRPEVFAFLEDVLGEVVDVFPGPYVHIGGDEAPKVRWRTCPTCQGTISREGLADEDELQSWFVRRIAQVLAGHGRRLVGWDEILEGGLAAGATVMSWRGMRGGRVAAAAGHDVVMTPHERCYLDCYQADPEAVPQPRAQPHVRTLRAAWSFDPTHGVPPEHAQRVLGGQGNLWTEYVTTAEHLERMAFPRLCGLAEALWSPVERPGWDDFCRRLDVHEQRLDALGVARFAGPRE